VPQTGQRPVSPRAPQGQFGTPPVTMTLNINPQARPKTRSPMANLMPVAPTINEYPISPGFHGGPQVAGFTTIRTTNLMPTIPNVLVGHANAPQAFIAPNNAGTPTIRLPTFNTVVTPVTVNTPKRPTLGTMVQQGPHLQPAPGSKEDKMAIFADINPELLVGERTGKNKKGYSLNVLQSFAQRLQIPVSGRRKQQLIDDIEAQRRENGLT